MSAAQAEKAPSSRAALPATAGEWTLIRNARQIVTLQGASGPRRGPALGQLGIIPGGVMLIHNGLVEEVGSARRVENLAHARRAREIDAAGKIVLPAFCDPDMALVAAARLDRTGDARVAAQNLATTSRARAVGMGSAVALEWARYGCLAVGSHTGAAGDGRNTIKILRAQRLLQLKPLRVRSIVSLSVAGSDSENEAMVSRWLPAVRRNSLANVTEFVMNSDAEMPVVRKAGVAAATLGFAIRLRSDAPAGPELLRLALDSGAMAIVAPPDLLSEFAGPLGALGCVRVIPMAAAFDDPARAAAELRAMIDDGSAVALASGPASQGGCGSANMQFWLHAAVERLGLSPEEAIVAATYNAACALRMSHTMGSIEPGKYADLAIMDVPDYRDLPRRAGHHDVSMVVRGGNVIWRAAGSSAHEGGPAH